MGVSDVVDSKRLEDLAVLLAKDFLRDIKTTPANTINLTGRDCYVLGVVKEKMESYLKERGMDVQVGFGEGGYHIDINHFVR